MKRPQSSRVPGGTIVGSHLISIVRQGLAPRDQRNGFRHVATSFVAGEGWACCSSTRPEPITPDSTGVDPYDGAFHRMTGTRSLWRIFRFSGVAAPGTDKYAWHGWSARDWPRDTAGRATRTLARGPGRVGSDRGRGQTLPTSRPTNIWHEPQPRPRTPAVPTSAPGLHRPHWDYRPFDGSAVRVDTLPVTRPTRDPVRAPKPRSRTSAQTHNTRRSGPKSPGNATPAVQPIAKIAIAARQKAPARSP